MERRYADKRNVIEALREATDAEDEGRLEVLDTDAVVIATTEDEMEERNLWAGIERIDDTICTIDWETNSLTGTPMLTLHFHEKVVEHPLEVMPAGHNAIAPTQATQPYELGHLLEEALKPLDEELDAHFTFAEVSAGSMGSGGHYTDFEYEYSIDTTNEL